MDIDRGRVSHPNLPEEARVSAKYNDKTHNGLCKCIVACIELMGGEATRVTTSGRQITKCKTEVKGSGKQVWIRGTTKRGTPDVRGTLRAISLYVEVKVGKDTQKPDQEKVENQANSAGGRYYLARDFESFYQWITKLNQL